MLELLGVAELSIAGGGQRTVGRGVGGIVGCWCQRICGDISRSVVVSSGLGGRTVLDRCER